MKALITAIDLTSALVSGITAASNIVQLNQLGVSNKIRSNLYASNKELVIINSANLPVNSYGSEIFVWPFTPKEGEYK